MKTRRAQSLSFDAIAAVILFIIVLTVILVYVNSSGNTTERDKLQREALVVSQGLIVSSQTNNQTLVKNGQIDMNKYDQLRKDVINDENGGYAGVKDMLGITSEYCIYLEDQNGSIVLLNDGNYSFFGSNSSEIILTSPAGIQKYRCSGSKITP